MRRVLAFAIASLILAGAVCAQDKPKPAEPAKPAKDDFAAVLTDKIKAFNELTDTLAKVTDDKSAKEFASKLETHGKSLADIDARAAKLGKPSADEDKALTAKFQTELIAVFKRMMTETDRMKNQPYGKAVLDAFLAPVRSKPKEPAKPAPEKPKEK